MSKNALSAVTSTLLGGGASARPVRLADLEGRESWGPAESMQRALFLPAIESSFETLQSTGGGFRDFGLAFYGTLFDQQEGDSLRDEVFNGESLEVLSLKLHSGTSEMIRIAKMERPTELASRMMELGLTHLEYGVKEAHLEPYKAATLDCLRRVMVGRGLKWTRTQARAWGWMLELLGGLMMETLVEAGPKVARLRASWTELCAELHADQLAGGSKLVPFLSQSSLLRSFNNQLARGSFSRKNGISPSSQRNDRRNPFTSGEIEPLQEQQQQQEMGRGAAVRPLMMSPLSSLPNHHHHYQQQQQSNFASTAANDTPSSPTEQLATTVSNAADTVTVRADATAGITDDEGQPLPELEVATSPTGGGGGGRLYSSTAATRGRGSVLGSLDKVAEIFSERWSGSDRELLLKPSDSGVGDRSSKSMEAPGGGGYSDRGGSQRATTTTTTTPSNATASLIGLVGVSRQVNKMKEKLKVMVASSRDSIDAADGGKLMTLWSKAHGNGGDARVDNVAHREGRRIAGRVLLSVMSASEPSLRAAVMQFHGRSEAKAEETLGNALELLVRCATRPHLLRDKLRLVALRHSRMGLGPEAAEAAEAVLFEFLPLLLQPAGRWDEATESAWRWNWDIVKTALVRHMKRSGRLLEALSRSWEVLEVNGRCEELGGRFYRRLFESAGEKMAALFARPEKMQHAMFQRALGLLVESMQEPETVQAELESIAMKHIKYDITREHIDIFGTVLVASLKVPAPSAFDVAFSLTHQAHTPDGLLGLAYEIKLAVNNVSIGWLPSQGSLTKCKAVW
jgi:hemoglobin-like flavoprotein